jgi:hypothetical protein
MTFGTHSPQVSCLARTRCAPLATHGTPCDSPLAWRTRFIESHFIIFQLIGIDASTRQSPRPARAQQKGPTRSLVSRADPPLRAD